MIVTLEFKKKQNITFNILTTLITCVYYLIRDAAKIRKKKKNNPDIGYDVAVHILLELNTCCTNVNLYIINQTCYELVTLDCELKCKKKKQQQQQNIS